MSYSSVNKDYTTREHGLGSLVKCHCGVEFYVSFEKGLACYDCRRKRKIKITDELVKEVFDKHNGE